jgi:glycosyltransferase involved in cell wall biosynthesis
MFKILTFFPFVSPAPTGGDSSFIETVKRWSIWGNQIHIVTTSLGYNLLRQHKVEFIPYIFGAPEQNKGWREFLGSHLREIMQILQIPGEKFDFIYCPSEVVAYIIPSFFAKMELKIPLVIEFKLLREHEGGFFSWLKYLTLCERKPLLRPIAVSADTMVRNFLAKKADLVLVLSNQDRRTLVERVGLSPNRIRVIKHGINYEQIAKVKADGRIFDACFLGHIIPRKGIFDLVKAWKKVVEHRPCSRLAIIGDGSREICDKLDSMIADLNMSQNIIRLGWMNDDKYAIMKKSRIFIFPSHGEAFALAVCEAMACGLPVVAYDLPQFKELYHKGMVRVEKGNVTKLALMAKTLLENQDMQEKLSKDALEQAKEYDWDKAAGKELEVISENIQLGAP